MVGEKRGSLFMVLRPKNRAWEKGLAWSPKSSLPSRQNGGRQVPCQAGQFQVLLQQQAGQALVDSSVHLSALLQHSSPVVPRQWKYGLRVCLFCPVFRQSPAGRERQAGGSLAAAGSAVPFSMFEKTGRSLRSLGTSGQGEEPCVFCPFLSWPPVPS